MKSKHLALITVTLAAIFLIGTSSSYAGDKQRHRWEGVAMGVGAAILGHHILSNVHGVAPAYPLPLPIPVPVPGVHYFENYVHHGPKYYPPPKRHRRPPRIVHHHYHGNGGQYCNKHHRKRRPPKEIHHHYYGGKGEHHPANYHRKHNKTKHRVNYHHQQW